MIDSLIDMATYKDYLLVLKTMYVWEEYKMIWKAPPIVDGYLRCLALTKISHPHGITNMYWTSDLNCTKKLITTFLWHRTPQDGRAAAPLPEICIIIYGPPRAM